MIRLPTFPLSDFRTVYGQARKAFFIFLLGLPFGLLMGMGEVFVGAALAFFLTFYGLIPGEVSSFPAPMLWAGGVATLLVAGFLRAFFSFLCSVTSNLAYEAFCAEMRSYFAQATLLYTDNKLSSAELSNMFSNTIPRSGSLTSSLSQFFSNVLILIMLVVGLLSLSWQLTIIAIAMLFLVFVPLYFLKSLYQRYSAQVYSGTSSFTHRLIRAAQNQEFLFIVGKNRDELTYLRELNGGILSSYFRYIVGLSANSSWPQFGGVLVLAGITWLNFHYQLVTVAVLIPFIYILTRLASTLSNCTTALGTFQFSQSFFHALATVIRRLVIKDFLTEGGDSARLEPRGEMITVHGLSIGRGNATLLEHIDFRLESGDFLLVAGPSGKGKTTLLMTLIGIVAPIKGNIQWDGQDLNLLDSISLRKIIAFSGADPFLLDASVRENLLFGAADKHLSDLQLKEALTCAECDFILSDPAGPDRKLAEGGEGISAGQKQRLSIARALLRSPSVLLLDESTANLDLAVEAKIFQNIRKKLPSSIIVAVSHRESIRQYATKILEV